MNTPLKNRGLISKNGNLRLTPPQKKHETPEQWELTYKPQQCIPNARIIKTV